MLKRFAGIALFLFVGLTFLTRIDKNRHAIPLTDSPLTLASPQPQLPSLEEFSASLASGQDGELIGVYAPEKFALKVVQQPATDPAFVSSQPETLTQFRSASAFHSVGLLAHNYLAGAHFVHLKRGDSIILIYGKELRRNYQVDQVQLYRALDPQDPFSQFIHLQNPGKPLTSTDLFYQIYAHSGRLILQTCIEQQDSPSWGRRFVIAQPVNPKIMR